MTNFIFASFSKLSTNCSARAILQKKHQRVLLSFLAVPPPLNFEDKRSLKYTKIIMIIIMIMAVVMIMITIAIAITITITITITIMITTMIMIRI